MLKELIIAFSIVAVCVVMHTAGMLALAEGFSRYIKKRPDYGFIQENVMLITTFTSILFLHLTGAAIWAILFRLRELFPDFETAMYFSLTSYTTMGFGDVVLPERWRLLGGVEGLSGVLLSGMSTAFLFVIVRRLLRVREKQTLGPELNGGI